ncbi:MAG: BamA/TamA family outer membrane protein [Bacteroidetes bacterium]|nr:BamA/TamA family outer membrane protein [Bacteroidota bacterium]
MKILNAAFAVVILLNLTNLFSQEDTLSTNGPITVGEEFFIDYRTPKDYELGPIRIVGADNFDHQAIKLIAGLRQGQSIKIPGDQITTALKNLYKEELFSSISIAAEKEIAGVLYLVITVEPRPKLSRFKFIGIKKREADKVREEINLYAGRTITENLVFSTESKIRGYFREKGFYSVDVDIKRTIDTLMNNSEVFEITINTGEKVKIQEVVIEGNESISDFKLKMAMKDTKEKGPLRIFKRSKFSTAAFDRDKKAVLDKFNAIGLRDASFSLDTFFLIDPQNLVVQLKIEEGEKYFFGDITWIGNTKYRSSYLDTILGIKNGDVYDKGLLEQRLFQSVDGRDITSLYMDRGYLFFQITPVEMNVTDNRINYEMRIIEGKEARVKNIIIKGNTKTNEYVIRREIRTKPGDLFSRNDIIRTQRELAQLGYFNEQAFQVNPLPNPADGTVDIEYVVEEKSSDQVELSGGYGGVGQNGRGSVIGTLGLTFNNFSTKNFFKKSAWQPLPSGDGQRFSVRGQTNGRFYQSFNASFTEPWLGGKKPNSLTLFSTYTLLSQNGMLKTNPDFSGTTIGGAGVGFGRRKKLPDDFFTAYYELGFQKYNVTNDTRFGVLFTNGIANDISLKYVLQRNSISAPIYPQSGSSLTFTAKSTLPYSYFETGVNYAAQSAQERYKYLEYYKLKFTGAWYLPLSKDKKLVLSPRIGFGLMGAYTEAKGITPFDRFTLGGSGLTGISQIGGQEIIALRGYEDNSLSTRGGNPLIAKYTLELRYPISLNPQATFFAMAFAEAGNTFPSIKEFDPFNVKRAAGVGIRVFLPAFGMLGLDYGFGFDKIDYWGQGFANGSENQSISQKGYYPKLTFTIGMNLGEL